MIQQAKEFGQRFLANPELIHLVPARHTQRNLSQSHGDCNKSCIAAINIFNNDAPPHIVEKR
uniref:CSON010163 protein n=1 Tax=Culicoides sonorensis TaxID=179676 RepID=A0A336LPA2_CULSO